MTNLLNSVKFCRKIPFEGYNRCCYSSWTPLGRAFNQRQPTTSMEYRGMNKGLFDVYELVDPDGFLRLKNRCIVEANALMSEAASLERKRKMVQIFDDLSDRLCQVADLSDFLRVVHPNKEYSKAAKIAGCTVSGLVEKLNTNKKLYRELRRCVRRGDIMPTTKMDKRVARLFLFDFEQSGIHYDEKTRNEIVALNNEILRLGQVFSLMSLESRYVDKETVPEEIRDLFPCHRDVITISCMHSESSNPLAREVAYKIYHSFNEKQEEVLEDFLGARRKLARICGFKNYAERALRGGMLDKPEMVSCFLNTLAKNLRSRADRDLEIMNILKRNENPDYPPLAPWDVPYFTQRFKKSVFGVSPAKVAPYFSLGACMEGLSMIFTNIFGIRLENAPLAPNEAWDRDVYKLSVIHETEGVLGYIYCDFYERHGKPNQDCHFTIKGGRETENGYQLPVVVIVLNMPPPRWSTPTLLHPCMVDNLFHEMGHAMHSMLGRTKYQHVTGTRCSTDLAEVPSILMEYYSSDPRVIKKFAKHFQTEEPMPDALVDGLCASKDVFIASDAQIQNFYSMVDFKYHTEYPFKGGTTDALAEIQEEYYSLPHVPDTAWQLRFSHLVGYGSKYYSYLACNALASWIWNDCFEADPFNRDQGERYRREFLAHGGGKDPGKLILDFLKREPTPDRLAEEFIRELDVKNEKVKERTRIPV